MHSVQAQGALSQPWCCAATRTPGTAPLVQRRRKASVSLPRKKCPKLFIQKGYHTTGTVHLEKVGWRRYSAPSLAACPRLRIDASG